MGISLLDKWEAQYHQYIYQFILAGDIFSG
jgi:hypothetical protein